MSKEVYASDLLEMKLQDISDYFLDELENLRTLCSDCNLNKSDVVQ